MNAPTRLGSPDAMHGRSRFPVKTRVRTSPEESGNPQLAQCGGLAAYNENPGEYLAPSSSPVPANSLHSDAAAKKLLGRDHPVLLGQEPAQFWGAGRAHVSRLQGQARVVDPRGESCG